MLELHFFEVLGTLVVRESGSNAPVECVVVRTFARRQSNGIIQFVEVASGSSDYAVSTWFNDWEDERDNHIMGAHGDSGRPVDIAMVRGHFEAFLYESRFASPPEIAAVKVGNVWLSTHRLSQ